MVWLQLLDGLQPVPCCQSALASVLKLLPRQSWTLAPAGTVTSASLTRGPLACAPASGAVRVTPVPLAPAVPTPAITACSDSIVMWLPAARPETLATLTFVAPAAEAAERVVVRLASTRCVASGIAATTLVPLGETLENVTTSPT